MYRILFRALRFLSLLPAILALVLLLQQDSFYPRSEMDRARVIAAPYEFEFLSWEVDALWGKFTQYALGEERYIPDTDGHTLVLAFNKLMDEIHSEEDQLSQAYADPAVTDKLAATAVLRADIAAKRDLMASEQLLVESILQGQVSAELRKAGFAVGGAVYPPVMFHYTQIPYGLVISPRTVIRTDVNLQLNPGLTLEQQVQLENEEETRLDVSALVVPLGGLSTYPTMIMESTWTNWVVEAVTHEWTHTYLYFTPLGAGYETSSDLRTINETTADLFGKALGAQLIRDYFPELAPASAAAGGGKLADSAQPFDFAKEMHITRVEADRLLAAGDVAGAEAYMEQRRQLFVANGYNIRRLNQAYFAFYGTYADTPGERGNDPVGPAVNALFAVCPTPAAFLRTISQVTSLAQLQALTGSAGACH
jgi:hypothetical protein